MKTKNLSILSAVIGLALTIFGFMTSDDVKYPAASKFSGVMQILGISLLTLGVFTLYPKANPIKLIAGE